MARLVFDGLLNNMSVAGKGQDETSRTSCFDCTEEAKDEEGDIFGIQEERDQILTTAHDIYLESDDEDELDFFETVKRGDSLH